MKCSPGRLGPSAGSSTETTLQRPIFSTLPRAFSSMVLRPPRMLPWVGCEPSRSASCSMMKSWYAWKVARNFWRTSGVAHCSAILSSAPVTSLVSPKIRVAPIASSRSKTRPTVGLEASPLVVSDSPHLVERVISPIRPVRAAARKPNGRTPWPCASHSRSFSGRPGARC
jgi:hypothetical protein